MKKSIDTNAELQELRKIASNKKCFDCNQVGTTYAAPELGIFLCSICGGIHREFSHRIKGLSTCNFSEAEVNKLKTLGNERAALVWMAKHDSRSFPIPDVKDSKKLKDFLRIKYVDRRFYENREIRQEVPAKVETRNEEQKIVKKTSGSVNLLDDSPGISFKSTTNGIQLSSPGNAIPATPPSFNAFGFGVGEHIGFDSTGFPASTGQAQPNPNGVSGQAANNGFNMFNGGNVLPPGNNFQAFPAFQPLNPPAPANSAGQNFQNLNLFPPAQGSNNFGPGAFPSSVTPQATQVAGIVNPQSGPITQAKLPVQQINPLVPPATFAPVNSFTSAPAGYPNATNQGYQAPPAKPVNTAQALDPFDFSLPPSSNPKTSQPVPFTQPSNNLFDAFNPFGNAPPSNPAQFSSHTAGPIIQNPMGNIGQYSAMTGVNPNQFNYPVAPTTATNTIGGLNSPQENIGNYPHGNQTTGLTSPAFNPFGLGSGPSPQINTFANNLNPSLGFSQQPGHNDGYKVNANLNPVGPQKFTTGFSSKSSDPFEQIMEEQLERGLANNSHNPFGNTTQNVLVQKYNQTVEMYQRTYGMPFPYSFHEWKTMTPNSNPTEVKQHRENPFDLYG